ncbi:hypothetical protein RhiirC2_182207 [Rhizophagus irregularis]|uniref:Uncharacterized protein n=1 Tax=Rhizophagus irregularis TaxID=588596 RepID=A0A2N1ML20_9GLOM|nr:hypothetical protein RhiirC2_182207 [Rhizophagus irregularis]
MESAYNFTEYRYRFLKETKNYSSADSRNTIKGHKRVSRGNRLSRTEKNFLESIRNDAVHRKETTLLSVVIFLVVFYSAF